MIPFNIFGHSKTAVDDNSEPIIWVDSSDNGSYTISGNIVTSLLNKGTLGGAMTLNGSVKFANSGFESWSVSDRITKDMGSNWIGNTSFTIALTFDLQNVSSGYLANRNSFMELGTNPNTVYFVRSTTDMYNIDYRQSTSNLFLNSETYTLGVQTILYSFDLTTTTGLKLLSSGLYNSLSGYTFNTTTNNNIINLLNQVNPLSNSGAYNPLHEFRLYDRAMSLTQMQDLQTELNNKYTL